MFPDNYPYTNFHELNLGYFITHFREIFSQWADLYDQMIDWKDATDAELATWKTGVETDLENQMTEIMAELETWKAQTGQDIAGWEDATLAALTAWQTATQAVFEAIRVEAAGSASAAAASAGDAATAKTAAETAQAAAEAAAASVQASAAQITTNAEDIADLKTQINDSTGNIEIQFSDPALKQYVNTSGTSIAWDNAANKPVPSTASGTVKWACVECSEGDKFTISGKGGTNYHLWTFIDTDKNILTPNALLSVQGDNIVITAPKLSAWLIINDIQNKKSYYGDLLQLNNELYQSSINSVIGVERPSFNIQTYISWVSASAPWTYSAYINNAATPAGILYSLKKGDTVELTDYEGVKFNVYTVNASNVYAKYVNLTNKFTASEDCQMAMEIQYVPGVALTDENFYNLTNRVYITHYVGIIKRITDNESDILELEEKTENIPAIVRVESLFTNINKYINASTKLIENSSGQNVTSAIHVKQGDILNYLLRANSNSVLIIALYSESTPSADAYIDGVVGGPVSSDWHKGQYAISQNGYLFLTTRTDALSDSYAYISREVSDDVNLLWNNTNPTVNIISQTLGNEPRSNYGERYTNIRNSGTPTPIEKMQYAVNQFMEEHSGNMRLIPVMVYTDMHILDTSKSVSLFNLAADILPEKEMSAYISLGDIVNDKWTDNAEFGLLKNNELEHFLTVTGALPKDKRIDVFGNHDTWYVPTGGALTYVPNLKYLSPYFNNSAQRRIETCPDNSGNMVIYDGYYMVKYIVIADWDYTNYAYPAVSTTHWNWIISELSKVDNYDIIILSHIPLWIDENTAIDPFTGNTIGVDGTVGFVFQNHDADVLWTGRKNKTAGIFTDASGTQHSYDFTNCKGNLLCSFHGHQHKDEYQYVGGELLEMLYGNFSVHSKIYFSLIDREERKLKTWRWTDNDAVASYEISLDSN